MSVVIPTHNRARFICAAIASVLSQTMQDFEIIIVDDASQDGTEAAVRRIQDYRIRYLRHPLGRGDAGARNTGIRNASGKYVAFLDDDDEWLPEKLALQTRLCENSGPDVAGVHTGRITVHLDTGKISTTDVRQRDADGLRNNSITTSSVLLRRDCLDAVGVFDEGIPFCSDYDLWIRISQRFRIEYIPQPLIRYQLHGSGLSHNLRAMIRGEEILLSKHRDFFAARRRLHSLRYLCLGTLYCYAGDAVRARDAYRTAIRIDPFSLRNYFNLCLTFLGSSKFKRVKEFKERLLADS